MTQLAGGAARRAAYFPAFQFQRHAWAEQATTLVADPMTDSVRKSGRGDLRPFPTGPMRKRRRSERCHYDRRMTKFQTN